MRILFLSTWFPCPADNGSKIRVYHLLRALGARHDVCLLSFAFGTAVPEAAQTLREFCVEVRVVRSDPFKENQTNSLVRFLSPVPMFTRPSEEMSRLVDAATSRYRPEVIIASVETMATYALKRPDGTTKVLEEHNSLTRMMWDRYRDQKSGLQRMRCLISWQKARHYEARLLRHFHLVTMVSEEDRKVTEQELPGYEGRVEVIPNGVDCQRNQPGLVRALALSLVFNGPLTYHANYDAIRWFLEEVYPLVQEQEPGVSLTITGSTSGIDLGRLRLDQAARVSGHVDDVRPLVAGAWACVVPIRQGGGTRLKILEAMALGTPVVSTTKGAEGLEVTPGKNILIADEPVEFAAQVVGLLHDPGLREHLAQNGRRLVEERYDWEAIGQRFVHLVESLAKEKSNT